MDHKMMEQQETNLLDDKESAVHGALQIPQPPFRYVTGKRRFAEIDDDGEVDFDEDEDIYGDADEGDEEEVVDNEELYCNMDDEEEDFNEAELYGNEDNVEEAFDDDELYGNEDDVEEDFDDDELYGNEDDVEEDFDDDELYGNEDDVEEDFDDDELYGNEDDVEEDFGDDELYGNEDDVEEDFDDEELYGNGDDEEKDFAFEALYGNHDNDVEEEDLAFEMLYGNDDDEEEDLAFEALCGKDDDEEEDLAFEALYDNHYDEEEDLAFEALYGNHDDEEEDFAFGALYDNNNEEELDDEMLYGHEDHAEEELYANMDAEEVDNEELYDNTDDEDVEEEVDDEDLCGNEDDFDDEDDAEEDDEDEDHYDTDNEDDNYDEDDYHDDHPYSSAGDYNNEDDDDDGYEEDAAEEEHHFNDSAQITASCASNDVDQGSGDNNRGEVEISRKDEIMKSIGKKLARYQNPWTEVKLEHGRNEANMYTEEADRFMLCMMHRVGYGNWEQFKAAVRGSTVFKYDWFVKSRAASELARRRETLVRLVEKENRELEHRAGQAAKEEARKDEVMKSIGKKLARYQNPLVELEISYGQNQEKPYSEEADRFMLCMVHRLGYGNWAGLRAAIHGSPLFMFDWVTKGRSSSQLARRCDTLIRIVEKENQELEEKEKKSRARTVSKEDAVISRQDEVMKSIGKKLAKYRNPWIERKIQVEQGKGKLCNEEVDQNMARLCQMG
ncbi:unnamed protein product [Calypogeia fissa]